MKAALAPVAALLAIGLGWGLATPLVKIAAGEGRGHFALTFWHILLVSAVVVPAALLRSGRIPLGARHLRLYAALAMVGAVIPTSASFAAAPHLPAGVLAILLAMTPLFTFPIAIAMGLERFEARRALGLALGIGCVALIASPGAELPSRAAAAFIPVALVAPLCFGMEGNVYARWGRDLDPVQTLAGASMAGLPLTLGLALAAGQWIDPRPPWEAADLALASSALIHACVYTGYLWLIGRSGPVFAAQVAYLVTGFGVAWSMVLLGESYSHLVWIGLALMLAGIFLVQPSERFRLARRAEMCQNGETGKPVGDEEE